MDVISFERLKKQIADSTSKKDRLQGQLEQLTARMKAEFDCNSLEELQTLHEDTKAQKVKLEKKFAENMAELQTLVEGNL